MRLALLPVTGISLAIVIALAPAAVAYAATPDPAAAATPAAPDDEANLPPPAPPAVALSARDRIAFNAGLDALVAGNLAEAQARFRDLAKLGETSTAREAAALIVDRLAGLERRRASGLLPPLRAPGVVAPAPPAVPAAPAPSANAATPAPDARAPVIATTTALGLALWGWTLPNALGLHAGDQGRAYLGLYMLTAAASFVVPYQITRDHPPSASQMNAIFYGGTRGGEWGLLLSNLIFGRAGGETDVEHERAFAASLLLGSVGGAIAGSLLAPRLELAPGDVRTVAALGDYGLFAGFALGHIFGLDQIGQDWETSAQNTRARAMSAAGLFGTLAGLGGGHLLASQRTNTWGDGEVMRGAGALGVFTGATAAVVFERDENNKVLLGLMLAGGGLGLLGGDQFVRNQDYSPGEALVIDLALVTGGLGGAGLTYLVSDSHEPKRYFIAATLGSAGCGAAVALALGRQQRGDVLARSPPHPAGRAGAPTRIALLPQFGAGRPSGLRLVGWF